MSSSLILIVEDDRDLRELMSVVLQSAGHRVLQVDDGEVALHRFHAHAPDLVILDISLGPRSIDGLEVCRRLRRHTDVPIVFLTARSEDIDQLIGFSAGADDYLAKPVNPRLLLARVTAVLRRAEGTRKEMEPTGVSLDGLDIDLQARTVMVDGVEVGLTRIQFDLLAALAANPKRVVTREQLVERVWGDWFGDDHHLDVHMSRLRQRISDAGGPRVAHAVRGVGFRFSG